MAHIALGAELRVREREIVREGEVRGDSDGER